MVTAELDTTVLAGTRHAASPDVADQRLLRSSVLRIKLQRLAMRGLPANEAAAVLGISACTARMHYSDPVFRQVVTRKVEEAWGSSDATYIERTKTLTERIEEQAGKSFSDLINMLDPVTNDGKAISDNLKYRIHTQFLDRHQDTAPISKSKVMIDPMTLSVSAAAAREMDTAVIPINRRLA